MSKGTRLWSAVLCALLATTGCGGGGAGGGDNAGVGTVPSEVLPPPSPPPLLAGRFVAFETAAALVPQDTNGTPDVYVYDGTTAGIAMVSTSSSGELGNNSSTKPSISEDGRFIAFQSAATNLGVVDGNFGYDVFVHDRVSGTTTLVSTPNGGGGDDSSCENPAISANGRYVVFESWPTTGGMSRIYWRDLQTGQTLLVSRLSDESPFPWYSYVPAISGDGMTVAFASDTADMNTGDETNILVYDVPTGTMQVLYGGMEGDSWAPALSSTGRFISFFTHKPLQESQGDYDRDVYLVDRLSNTVQCASVGGEGKPAGAGQVSPSISGDGRFVAFATNFPLSDKDGPYTGYFYSQDVYVRDLKLETTVLVSWNREETAAAGHSTGPSLSPDGRFVFFYSQSPGLLQGKDGNVQSFARDLWTEETVSLFSTGQATLPSPR